MKSTNRSRRSSPTEMRRSDGWPTRPPNVEEATESLKGIVEEGTRAGEVIARIRELLKHRKPNYVALDIE